MAVRDSTPQTETAPARARERNHSCFNWFVGRPDWEKRGSLLVAMNLAACRARRYGLRDDPWERIQDLLPGGKKRWERRPKIIVCLWMLFCIAIGRGFRSGICRSGSVASGGAHALQPLGRKRHLGEDLPTLGCGCGQRIRLDRQHHRSRASAQCEDAEKGGDNQVLGHSRGGLSSKINATVDELGNPTNFTLTPGQAHDLERADILLPEI